MSVELTRLPSGLTIVTDAMSHLETASLGVWVGSGSRDEKQNEHGVSHLLEHMAFKGTKRRTARQIAEEIEAVGGDLNAATSVETTAYYARVLKADVPLALDVLSDILADPSFDPVELKREQNVIVQEIGAAEDDPGDLVFEYLQEEAFPDQPIGRSILGTRESVRGFKPDDLRTYLARNYCAPDMFVIATGAVNHANVVKEAEQRFASFSGTAAPAPVPAKFGGGTRVETSRSRTGASRLRRSKACRSAIPISIRCRFSRACWAAECRRACSRKCARCAGSAIRSIAITRLIPTPVSSGSMPARIPKPRRN